jgi:hypothetical protein
MSFLQIFQDMIRNALRLRYKKFQLEWFTAVKSAGSASLGTEEAKALPLSKCSFAALAVS